MVPLTGAAGKGILAGRLEVECCSWGGGGGAQVHIQELSLHWMPVSKTKLPFLRAHGGGLPQSWTEGKAVPSPQLHIPRLRKTLVF